MVLGARVSDLFVMKKIMNNQYMYVRTGLMGRVIFCTLLSLAIIFSSLVCFGKISVPNGIYIKPSIDNTVMLGEPGNDEIVGFDVKEVSAGNGISFCIAGVLYRQVDGCVKVFLTNPTDAKVNLLLEIKDVSNEKTIFKTGLIEPGYFVERVKPKGKWENASTPIKICVYAMDPDSNYSQGTIEFETMLQPW